MRIKLTGLKGFGEDCALSLLEGYEFFDGSIVCFFNFRRKVAAWKFVVCPMASYALTALAFSVAGICAWTVC